MRILSLCQMESKYSRLEIIALLFPAKMSGEKTGLVLIATSSFPAHYVHVFTSNYKLLFSKLLYLYSRINTLHLTRSTIYILKYETICSVLWEVLEM